MPSAHRGRTWLPEAGADQRRPRRLLPLTRRQVRGAIGAFWLLDAALQCQPVFFSATGWRQDVAQSVMGQPSWVNHSIFWAIGIISVHAALCNTLFVAVQLALGISLLTDRWSRLAIVASVPYALGVWWVGEGFGALPTGFAILAAGAPGAALLYPLLGFLAWPRRSSDRPDDPVVLRAGHAAWVALWAGQCLLLLPWVYPPGQVLTANIEESSIGDPRWLADLARHATAVVTADPPRAMAVLAVVQLAIGLGILHRRTRRAAIVAALACLGVFWFVGQDLGGILGAGATDPNAAPLLAVMAMALWPRQSATKSFHFRHPASIPLRRAGDENISTALLGTARDDVLADISASCVDDGSDIGAWFAPAQPALGGRHIGSDRRGRTVVSGVLG